MKVVKEVKVGKGSKGRFKVVKVVKVGKGSKGR